MPLDTTERVHPRPVVRRDAFHWRPALLVVLVSLAIRCLQLWAITIASASQAASGPKSTDGTPFEYFVYSPTAASPGLEKVLSNWDGQWYMRIAEIGYPPADQVRSAQDAWTSAFPPGFPTLTKVTMSLTGLSFSWAALLINTALTLFAAVLLYELLRSTGLTTRVAVAGGVGVSLLPGSPVLVAAYSEALALALIVLALRLLIAHRYLLMSLAIIGLAVTRPVALAFAPVLVVHAAMRWRAEGRSVSWQHRAEMAVATLTAVVSPWVWPWSAARLYGVPEGTAFAGSERTSQTVSGLGSGYLGSAFAGSGIRGLIVVTAGVLIMVVVPVVIARRAGWPVELMAWGGAYAAMVVIVTPPSPSLLRYFVLAAPLLVVVFAAPLRRPSPIKIIVLTLLVGVSLWTQWLWIRHLLVLNAVPFFAP